MSAEVDLLRRAATAMRQQHGPGHPRHTLWTAIAFLLDERASVWCDNAPLSRDYTTLAVACAFLGESAASP